MIFLQLQQRQQLFQLALKNKVPFLKWLVMFMSLLQGSFHLLMQKIYNLYQGNPTGEYSPSKKQKSILNSNKNIRFVNKTYHVYIERVIPQSLSAGQEKDWTGSRHQHILIKDISFSFLVAFIYYKHCCKTFWDELLYFKGKCPGLFLLGNVTGECPSLKKLKSTLIHQKTNPYNSRGQCFLK